MCSFSFLKYTLKHEDMVTLEDEGLEIQLQKHQVLSSHLNVFHLDVFQWKVVNHRISSCGRTC